VTPRRPRGHRPGETQPERTALAWQRTGLGILAVAGLIGHGAVARHNAVLLAVAGGGGLVGLAVLGGLAPLRYRAVRRLLAATGHGRSAPGLAAAATAAVAMAGLAALVAVLTLR
jgi:putative membrane protein